MERRRRTETTKNDRSGHSRFTKLGLAVPSCDGPLLDPNYVDMCFRALLSVAARINKKRSSRGFDIFIPEAIDAKACHALL